MRRIAMKSYLSYYLRYILFLLAIQVLFRIVFLILYSSFAQDAGTGIRLMALVYGLKMDASLTGYLLIVPTFLIIVFTLIRMKYMGRVLGIYTFLILLCLVLAYLTNLIVYRYWNFPIDRSVFDYISTPGEMLASLSPLSLVFAFGLVILLVYLLHFQVYRKWVSRPLPEIPGRKRWVTAVFTLILPALLLPIRGGIGTSPINTGSVYFSRIELVNHAAVNPVWNLFYTLTESNKLTQSAEYFPGTEVQEIVGTLYEPENHPMHVLNTKTPNIIMIFLESFAQPVVSELGGDGEAAPNFNDYLSEGIFFNRFYASGTMTDRSLGAVLGGYPAIPGTCIIYYEEKARKLSNLNRILETAGYHSAFFYGGDIDFAHINSYLITGGFERIISDRDFPVSIPRSSWGVPDHVLFERLLEETDRASTPFFHAVLTLSSHTPFDVPMEPVFPMNTYMDKYRNSVYYTDKSLGDFIEKAKTKDWWDRTLIILMADHGCRIGNISAHEQNRFRIPMLWLGGALTVTDTVITKYGSQTDVPLTLLDQLDLPAEGFKFSKDLMSPGTRSFAFYTFNDGVGFVNDSSYTVYSLTTESYMIKEIPDSLKFTDTGLAYLQYLLNDFNSK